MVVSPLIQACGGTEKKEGGEEEDDDDDDEESLEGLGQDLSEGEDDVGRKTKGPRTLNEVSN